jgi:hypothetical protein
MNATHGCVKSPDAALRFIVDRCGVFRGDVPILSGFRNMSSLPERVPGTRRNMSPTPHPSRFAHPAGDAFCGAVPFGNALTVLCMNKMLCRLVALCLLLLTVNACTGLKPLIPLDPARKAAVLESCRRPFLPGSYRLVHALERVMPDGAKETAIGILSADPRTRSFRTALMTIEGWVLFDAEVGETLTVYRAIPPFNAPAFAKALAEDIRLAFFPPGEEPEAWGEGEEGGMVCRFTRADGRLVEIMTPGEGAMEIRLYGTGREVMKRVTMAPPQRPGLAETLTIQGGWPPYTLRLRLLENETLDDESAPEPAATPSGPEPSGDGSGSEKGKRIP